MSKHIAQHHFYQLPSGSAVHPCRLIQKDGTLMWKHACAVSFLLKKLTTTHNNCSAPRGTEQLGVSGT